MRLNTKHRATFLVGAFLLSGIISGCGGFKSLLPDEAVNNFQSWRILYRYDYKGTELEKQRVTATHRALVAAVEDNLEKTLRLTHFPSDEADVTITIEERKQRSGFGQIKGLIKSESVYFIEFFDRNGEKLGSYREAKQVLIKSSTHEQLALKMARDITTILTR